MTSDDFHIIESALERISSDSKMPAVERYANLCVILATIRPVLVILKKILFIKPGWSRALAILIAAADAACMKY